MKQPRYRVETFESLFEFRRFLEELINEEWRLHSWQKFESLTKGSHRILYIAVLERAGAIVADFSKPPFGRASEQPLPALKGRQ